MQDTVVIIPAERAEAGDVSGEFLSLFKNFQNVELYIIQEKNSDLGNFGKIYGHTVRIGTWNDLCTAVTHKEIDTDSLFWIDDPGWVVKESGIINDLSAGFDPKHDMVIAVRRSVPVIEKIIGMLFFPEWKDPYSGLFAVNTHAFRKHCVRAMRGPVLPHLLARIPWDRILEIPVSAKNQIGAFPANTSKSRLFGLFQILYFTLYDKDNPLRSEMGKILRFAIVGFSGILVNTGFLYLFTDLGGIFYLASSALAIEISIITNFLLNDFWTFKSRSGLIRQRWKRFASYNFLALGGMAVNMVVLYLLTAGLGVFYLYANIIGILFAFLWNYLTNRNFTWK
jgi:putative flippase GtrA